MCRAQPPGSLHHLVPIGSVGGDFEGGLKAPMVSQSWADSAWVVFYSFHVSLFLSLQYVYPLDSAEVVLIECPQIWL